MKFSKMQGLGNDYIYINCFEEKVEDPRKLSINMSNRNFGIGSDGIVLIMPSNKADFKMRMFNSDGSEAEMCGNATRCLGKYVYEKKLTSKLDITLETLSGIKNLKLHIKDDIVEKVTVNMGEPILNTYDIPLNFSNNVFDLKILDKNFNIRCVSMGNPHAIIYLENLEELDIQKYGKLIENNDIFPNRTNVEFLRIKNKSEIDMRVWERGAGETLACGTGACAALVASSLDNKTYRKCKVNLLGGSLDINWEKKDNCVYMTGPCEFSFEGIWLK